MCDGVIKMRLRCIFEREYVTTNIWFIADLSLHAKEARIRSDFVPFFFLITRSCYRSGLCHLRGEIRRESFQRVKSRFNDQPQSLHLSVMLIRPVSPRLIDRGFYSLDDIAKKVNLFAKTEIEFLCQRVGSATTSMSCEVPFNKLDGRSAGFMFSAVSEVETWRVFFFFPLELSRIFPTRPSRIRLKATPCFHTSVR